MKFSKEMLELYLVTDRYWLNGRRLVDDVKEAILGGVTIVQLREKDLDKAAFIAEAKEIKALCHQYNVPFIINDNLEVALAVDSDGIHIGQDDLDAIYVRQQIGPDKILGISVHNLEEALLAKAQGADYLGIGAIFSTNTKTDATGVSFNQLKVIGTQVNLPSVAIGGINQDNCLQLKDSLIDGIAVVSAIMAAPDIKQATATLKNIAKEIYHD